MTDDQKKALIKAAGLVLLIAAGTVLLFLLFRPERVETTGRRMDEPPKPKATPRKPTRELALVEEDPEPPPVPPASDIIPLDEPPAPPPKPEPTAEPPPAAEGGTP